MRFLAIFDGLFFAWQWWEIALFKGKNRFAVGGVSLTSAPPISPHIPAQVWGEALPQPEALLLLLPLT